MMHKKISLFSSYGTLHKSAKTHGDEKLDFYEHGKLGEFFATSGNFYHTK